MKELRTGIDIDASPERVWGVLTDLARFPEWNPFIREAAGDLRPGGRLRVRLQPAERRSIVLRPIVLVCLTGRELCWRGTLGIRGLLDAEHIFTVEAIDGGRTRFVQRELFTGLLVPLFSGLVDGSTRQGFERMNHALKQRVEALSACQGSGGR